MRRSILFLLAAVLTGCGPSEMPQTHDLPTIDALASDPARLKQLRQQCRLERAKLGDELCSRVAEATRKRFYGDGKVPYTPPENPPHVLIVGASLRNFRFLARHAATRHRLRRFLCLRSRAKSCFLLDLSSDNGL